MRGGWHFLVALALWCAGSADASAEKRVALVIGNSAYQHAPRLSNPSNDATAVAKLLKDIGFDVVDFRRDLIGIDLRRAIREFSQHTRDADVAIVFYAGHWMELNGSNYLVPTDAKLEQDFDVDDETVSLDRFLAAVEPARHLRLVILDACRDNPFVKKMKRSMATRAVGQGLARIDVTSTDTLIAFAAKAGSVATDGEGANSPFTSALLKHLPTPGLDIRLVFGRVRDDVLASTRRRQEPFVYGSLGGSDVALVPAPAASAPANAAVDVRRDYELAGQVGTAEAWAAFLTQYPTGFYAELAREQRSKLLSAAARQPGDEATRKREEEEARAAEAERAKASREKAEREQTEREKSAPAQPAEPQVAMLPPAAEPEARPQPPHLSKGGLVRSIKRELKRVGCYDGDADENWDERALKRSIRQFVRYAKFSGAADEPNADFLDAVRGSDPGVCRVECGPRETERNGSCVAKGCPAGERLSRGGACIKVDSRREDRHKSLAKRHEEKPGAETRGKKADGGRESSWAKCKQSVGRATVSYSGSADARRFAMLDACARGGR